PSSPTYLSHFMIPLPPNSTPFPYTPLFRSSSCEQSFFLSLATLASLPDEAPAHRPRRPHPCRPARGPRSRTTHTRLDSRCRARLDRKSTRLNSSHVKISYAVFCLKKKRQHL